MERLAYAATSPTHFCGRTAYSDWRSSSCDRYNNILQAPHYVKVTFPENGEKSSCDLLENSRKTNFQSRYTDQKAITKIIYYRCFLFLRVSGSPFKYVEEHVIRSARFVQVIIGGIKTL